MAQITILYTPGNAGPGGSTPDFTRFIERLQLVLGAEMARDFRIVNVAPEPGRAESWRVSLEHPGDEAAERARLMVDAAGDPAFVSYNEEKSEQLAELYSPPPVPVAAPPLTLEIPAVLAEPESAQTRRAALRGIVAGIVISAALGFLSPAGSGLRQMFDPRTPSAAVTTGILCLFLWGIVYGFIRRGRLAAIRGLASPELMGAVMSGLRTHGPEGLESALRTDVAAHSPLLRRIRALLEQWVIRANVQNASLAVEQQVVSDREATQRGYTLLRLFVWATPVLGLIGTVVGISIAVGGFAGFLSTDVEDIAKIKAGLVGVTGGLSFAFLITLEGLLSSLILMLFTSNLQTSEERLYGRIEQDVSERFFPELQRLSPEQDTAVSGGDPEAWRDALVAATQRVMHAVDTAGRALLVSWGETHRSYVTDLATVRAGIDEAARHTAQALEDAAATAATALSDALGGATDRVLGGLKALDRTFEETITAKRNLNAETLAESRRAIAGYAADVARASESVGELGKVTRQVLEAQAALHVAMAQLGDSRLANLMADLDCSLKDLKPLLNNLSQPFVLHAVPVPVRASGAAAGQS